MSRISRIIAVVGIASTLSGCIAGGAVEEDSDVGEAAERFFGTDPVPHGVRAAPGAAPTAIGGHGQCAHRAGARR